MSNHQNQNTPAGRPESVYQNQGYPQHGTAEQGHPQYGYPQQGFPQHGFPLGAPGPRGNGVGVAALVIGIVAVVVALIPLLGMVAFGLGPIAVILGVIGIFLKNRKTGMAITGLILGVIATVVAVLVTSVVAASVQAVDDSLNAEHQVKYVVTTNGSANVSYWDGDGMSSKDVSGDWSKKVTVDSLTLPSMTVTGDLMDKSGEVSCTIYVDGKKASNQTGQGQAAMAHCVADTFGGE